MVCSPHQSIFAGIAGYQGQMSGGYMAMESSVSNSFIDYNTSNEDIYAKQYEGVSMQESLPNTNTSYEAAKMTQYGESKGVSSYDAVYTSPAAIENTAEQMQGDQVGIEPAAMAIGLPEDISTQTIDGAVDGYYTSGNKETETLSVTAPAAINPDYITAGTYHAGSGSEINSRKDDLKKSINDMLSEMSGEGIKKETIMLYNQNV